MTVMNRPDPREPNEQPPRPAERDNERPEPDLDHPATDPRERINEDAERRAREEAGTAALPAT